MEKLFDNKKIRTYSGRAGSVKFLLGGIGTGNISIGSRGQFADFEIFNEPSKGRNMPYTFFSVYSEFADGTKDARVLEGELNPPYERALGYFSNEMAGLPRFTSSSLKAAYPFVNVTLEDENPPAGGGNRVYALYPARRGGIGHSRRLSHVHDYKPFGRRLRGRGVRLVRESERVRRLRSVPEHAAEIRR